ncbi:hypothetical protein O6H91_05G009000 [Diphasiastrum complanatum]|uniref:Uncharacterized protein n=1 Tax=Diphasiastrum complanatum TaxID=34168 RepID=A0ACC2DKF0_DIPCM|nr:hypothetical protein O6H91_05G009000 [Diphasiastrum complanatum]
MFIHCEAMSNGSNNQACAACKFQRRRCSADCPLARYFPADQNQRFMNCKRLFGVSNMIRFLKEVHPTDKDDTMKSFIYEADARERDPVHGCLGIINRLKDQVAKLTEELHLAREQLHLLEQQHAATLYQQHLAQSLVIAGAPGTSHSPQVISPLVASYQYVHPNSHLNLDAAMEYDTRPAAFDSRQDYNISRQPYEPRYNEDIQLNTVHMASQVPEHELKSAAALFSLTSSQR